MNFKFPISVFKPFERYTPPGSAPGTVVGIPDEPAPVIRVMAYSNGDLIDKTVDSVAGLKELTETHKVTWINVDGLGDAGVVHQLGEMFGLHHLALEDVVNVHQRAKVEDYGDHLFIIARMIHGDSGDTEQIGFFVSDRYVLTFQEGKPGDCLDPVRERIRKSGSPIRKSGTDFLTYALLDSIIDHYFPVVEKYGEQLDEYDDVLMAGGDEKSVTAIHALRHKFQFLRRMIRMHREAINHLMRDPSDIIGDVARTYLRDCYDHTIQLGDAIDTYRETCSDLRDFHLSMLGNRSNEVMKTLTIIATIFIPLSFIAGLYGMNFERMPELHWVYGYPLALSIMGLTAGGLLLYFHRKGWFD